ncbi:hypothetical protein Efla_003848 [Eimeria flavescens]
MGIKGLTKFLADQAPSALHAEPKASLLGRVVAVDASMALYQFLTAVRDAQTMGNLTDEAGNVTSHLAGMLARVTRLLEQGIRPVYVFDGAAPEQKAAELEKRRARREEAEALAAAAKETGDKEELRKQLARTIRVSPEQNREVQQLLQLLGLPVVIAPGEAEAQCAELAKTGKVWATATEDADALTFGTPILIRNLSFTDSSSGSSKATAASGGGGAPGAKTHPVLSIHLDKVLQELKLTMDQFVDFCILCGCDYCGTIRGVGAKTAYALIKEHHTIEGVLAHLDSSKFVLPDPFPFQQARDCFKRPLVAPATDFSFKWTEVDEKGLKKFLVEERAFNEARVEGYLARLRKARSLGSQTRLESFFGSAVSKASDLKQQQQQQMKAAAAPKKAAAAGSGAGKKRKAADAARALPFKRRRRSSQPLPAWLPPEERQPLLRAPRRRQAAGTNCSSGLRTGRQQLPLLRRSSCCPPVRLRLPICRYLQAEGPLAAGGPVGLAACVDSA